MKKRIVSLIMAACMVFAFAACAAVGGKPTAARTYDAKGTSTVVTVDLSGGWSVDFADNAVNLYDGAIDGTRTAIASGCIIDKQEYNDSIAEYSGYDTFEYVDNGAKVFEGEGGSYKYLFDIGNGAYFVIAVSENGDAEKVYARFNVGSVETAAPDQTESGETTEPGEAGETGETAETGETTETGENGEAAETGETGAVVDGVTVDYGESDIYDQEELDAAINVIKEAFAEWDGCELHSISYAGDESDSDANLAWLQNLTGEHYINSAEFLMDFHTPVEGDQAWEADQEYTDYQWWLGMTEGGTWEVVTMGY